MSERRPFVVFAFDSTHVALDAEEALKAAALQVVPIPAPSTLGALCGLAMRLPPEQADRAREVLLSKGIEPRAEGTIEDI